MEEHIEFLGILFRSMSHLYWFAGSSSMFLVSLGALGYCLLRRPDADAYRLVTAFWGAMLFFHAFACVGATVHAYDMISAGKSPNGALFSVDCIWFNALGAAAYTAMLLGTRGARREASLRMIRGLETP